MAALGDGGALMAVSELETVVRLGLPMLIVVYDDEAYGAEVHHFGPDGHPLDTVRFPPADLAGIGRGFGCDAVTVRSLADLGPVRDWLDGPAGAPHADRRQGHLGPGCLVAGGSLPLTPRGPEPRTPQRPGSGGPMATRRALAGKRISLRILKAGGPPAGAGLAGGPPGGTCATCAVRSRKAVTRPPSRAPCSPRTARRPGRHPPPRGRALPTGTPPRRGSRRRRSPAPRRTSAAS